MKHFLYQNRIFLSLYFIFLIAGGIILWKFEKGSETLLFNSLHTGYLNTLFVWTTRLAELPLLLFVLIVAIRFSYGKGLILALNLAATYVVVQVLKHGVFAKEMRPSVYFEGKAHLDFVQGVEILRENSFPSGHTAGAFALFFMLSILVKDKRWSILFFILPLLVGISRMYLMEHFFRDVYAGSLVAVLVTITFYLTFVQSGYYENLKWKDKALWRW